MDNCQVGVFAALSDSRGGGLMDARLSPAQEWLDDRQRCLKAKMPLEENLKKKPQIALEMIQRVTVIGLRFVRVAFDFGYGSAWLLLRAIDAMWVKFVGDFKSDAVVHWSRRSAQGGSKGTTVVD